MRTEIGTNSRTEDEAEFTQNESVLLMLNDVNIDQQLFRVAIGFPGKHPVSDRDGVVKELKAQGKWEGEDQMENKTNETEMINNIEITGNQKENITENKTVNNGKEENQGTVDKQEASSNSTQKSNSSPFINSFGMFAILFGTVMYIRKTK
ncbi:hypothetical protein ASJ81_20485 [Methanosarcina spelaei]|uniref:Uncharacterized protein n=1 Tax=Methanosarcina spelaei TaxID=1036679 RepID=A0A2A2HSJ3_9EURY|nr:hypothetical protein [Methanosarcina spelaei]PAV12417.1 hypothetical protein ASJ81_20485 [Methanosarcina spelaei]